MAELVSICLSFPPEGKKKDLSPAQYDTQVKRYLKDLERQASSSAWTKTDKSNLLDLLNPTVNSIPYLVALNKQIKSIPDGEELRKLRSLALSFLQVYDPIQIRYVGGEWATLVDFIIKSAQSSDTSSITSIVTSLLRLDPTAGTFTAVHLHVVRTALEFGVPSLALPILDKTIYAFPQSLPKGSAEESLAERPALSNSFITASSGFTKKAEAAQVLEYYLSGAHIYIGMRNFARARLFLETVILHPSPPQVVSILQIEAYRKWLLVGLLSQGRRYPIPATMEQSVMKNIRSLTKPYEALADSFELRNWRKLQAEIDVAGEMWQEDGNARLVHEVANALPRYRVRDLKRTYVALPVSRVASHLQSTPAATAKLIQGMIEEGHIAAELSVDSAGQEIMRFKQTSDTPAQAPADLAAQSERISNLVAYIRDADRRLQLTKEYDDHLRRAKRSGAVEDPADAMDLTYDAPAPNVMMQGIGDDGGDDEDIMAL